jgi:16S rRNA (uracil1498-N3)-methyltransferase
VGPEGGWADDELAAVDARGVASVSLGARTLRTETAGLALLATVSALQGW